MELRRNSQAAVEQSAKPGVKSATRTIDILEYFATVNRPVRTCEISEAIGVPNSSADEILRTLAVKGYLSFNKRTKHYVPSYKIVGLVQAIEQRFFGGEQLRALLRDLRRVTGASVYMTAQNDCWVENVAKINGPWTESSDDRGYRRELVYFDGANWRPTTNFAGALLALQSNVDIIELVLRTQERGIAPKGQFAMNDLIEKVDRIRDRGFATCRRNDTVRVESVACPMRIPGGNLPMAVGVLGYDLLATQQSCSQLAMTIRGMIAHHSRNWTPQAT